MSEADKDDFLGTNDRNFAIDVPKYVPFYVPKRVPKWKVKL